MCYCNCPYERYPHGFNEEAVCTKTKWDLCPLEESEEEDNNEREHNS